jgi:protein-disulfide isomerase
METSNENPKVDEQAPVLQTVQVSKNQISVGSSIIVAGVLVAGAILFSHFDNKGVSTSNTSAIDTSTGKSLDLITSLAVKAGLNKKQFQKCWDEKRYTAKIDADIAEGETAGVNGTPYSVIFGPNGNTIEIAGAASYAEMKKDIDLVLASTSKLSISKDTGVPAVRPTDHILGDINAPIVIVEYSDIDCPYCKRFEPTIEKIVTDYQGKVTRVYRHFPLDSLHPNARTKAEATECALGLGNNDIFWTYIQDLIKNS